MSTETQTGVSAQEMSNAIGSGREKMIAQAAYLRAEKRGFRGGDPVADWLEAEAEIDALMARQRSSTEETQPAAKGQRAEETPAEKYEHTIAAQLQSATERLETLRPKLAKLRTGTRKELERELEVLDTLRDNLARKAGDMRRKSEKKREVVKEQAEKLLRDFKAGLERLGSRFDRQ